MMNKHESTPIDPVYPATPECNRMLEIRERSQAIGEFLEWLNEENIILCNYPVEGSDLYHPASQNTHILLHKFFNLDPDVIEAEKRAVLEHVRNNAHQSGIVT